MVGLLLLVVLPLVAQQKTIKGKITDAQTGKGLAGVVIKIKGENGGTVTRGDGSYALVVREKAILLLTSIGYKKKEVPVGDGEELNIQLKEDALQLEQIVVTGLGISQEKKALGYAVQDVKGSEILGTRETNVTQGLAGKVAGVQVLQSSGSAGAAVSVRIRGVSSLTGNNEPLWVVDGVPIDNSTFGTEQNTRGVDVANRAIDINPNDIETISVLKGAAASVQYGIRAANGVILITTKRGKETSRMDINVSSSIGFNNVNKLPEMQTTWAQGLNGTYIGPGSGGAGPLRSWGPAIGDLRYDASRTSLWDARGTIVPASQAPNGERVVGRNNLESYFVTGRTFTNALTVSGGNSLGNYLFSLSNLQESGIVPNNTFDRTTFRFTGTANFTPEFSMTGSVTYANSGGTRIQRGSNTSGVMLGLMRTPATFDNAAGIDMVNASQEERRRAYLFPDGRQRTYIGFGTFDNPYFTTFENPFRDRVDRVQGMIEATYKPFSWLTITERFGADFYADRRKQIFHRSSTYANGGTSGGVIEDVFNSQDINNDIIATIQQNLTEDLALTVLVGNNFFQKRLQNATLTGLNLSSPDFYNVGSATTQNVAEFNQNRRTAAFYGDVKLSYKDWLFFNLTARNEWSTTLPQANASFFYPAVNLGFVFTQALGMPEDGVLGYGKIRASWAQVGNSAQPYSLSTPFSIGGFTDGWVTPGGITFPFAGQGGFQIATTLGNPNLRAEITTEWEVGTELKFLNNLVSLDLLYYNRVSRDLILPVPVAPTSGFLNVNLNAGQISTKGWEALLTLNLVRTDELSADIAVNFSAFKNNVDELAPGVTNIFLAGFNSGQAAAIKDYPFSAIFGQGFLQDEQGRVLIQGARLANGNANPRAGFPVGLDPVQKFLGSPYPDWLMGIRPTVSYMGFTLTALLDIRQGGRMFNGTKGAQTSYGMSANTENRTRLEPFQGVLTTQAANGTWASTGEPNTIALEGAAQIQDYYVNVANLFSNYGEGFLEDISWRRLREISLSYRLPSALLEGSFLRGATVSVTGRNIWLDTKYTGIDPESNLTATNQITAGGVNQGSNGIGIDYYGFPNTKSWVVSVSLNF
jgi:TonB-linked SusC/RagA family outer membrane protein